MRANMRTSVSERTRIGGETRRRGRREVHGDKVRTRAQQQGQGRSSTRLGPTREWLSKEFAQLCDAQLVLLADASEARVRSSIYLTTPESLQTRSMRLKKVAHHPSGDARETHSWEDVPDALLADDLLERSLTHESAISLPESGSLVMPLVYGPLLLGLLVIEPEDAHEAVVDLYTEEEEARVRLIAKTLASAATLEIRSDRLAKQSEKKSQLLTSLVGQFRGSLDALKGLGSMLVPRMEDDDPSKDMASGILSQGDRLQEVVSQLEYVLHPGSYTSRRTVGSTSSSVPWLADRTPLQARRYLQEASAPTTPDTPAAMNRAYRSSGRNRNSSGADLKARTAGSCDLQEVLSPLLATATPVAASSGVSILAMGGAGPDPLLVDVGVPDKTLTRVLSNVIDAAMLHVPKGGRIEVSATDGPGNFVSIQVAFSGPNWSDLPTTFESVTSKRNIVIAQSQVEAEGGSLIVQSPFPDACVLDDDLMCQGTMITIEVPAGPIKQLPKPVRVAVKN